MRGLPTLAILALGALLAASAGAQDPAGEPGCPQGNPCDVILEIDAAGIADLSHDTFATGDWIVVSVFNADDVNHTVRLEGHSFTMTIAGGDLVDSMPFKLGAPGSYDLTDEPSGDSAAITVQEEEVFSSGPTSDGGGNGIPGVGAVLLLTGLVALAAWTRRQ